MNISEVIAGAYLPIAKEYFNSNKTVYILKGGRSSAKGSCAYTLLLIDLAQSTKGAIVYTGMAKNLREGPMAQIEECANRIAQKSGVNVIDKVTKNPLQIKLKSGSIIHFSGLEKADDSKGKVGNPVITRVIFDEIGDYKNEQYWRDAFNTYVRNDAKFILIGNPPANKSHFFYDLIDEFSDQPMVHTTYKDVLEYLPQSALDAIDKLSLTNPKRYEFDWLGLPVGADGLAHPTVDDNIFIESLPSTPIDIKFIVIDYGMSDATCISYFTRRTDGSLIMESSYYHDCSSRGSFTLDDLVAALRSQFYELPNYVYVDGAVAAAHLAKHYFPQSYNLDSIRKKDRNGMMLKFNLVYDSGKFKMLDTYQHKFIKKQLENSEIEIVGGKEVPRKSKVRNIERQDHGADVCRYAAWLFGKEN